MTTRTFAMLFGIVFLAIGLAGVIGLAGYAPGLISAPEGGAMAGDDMDHGMLLGMFAVNQLHNIVHVLFGLWGLIASRSLGGSVMYARAVALIYALLTIMGLVPALDDAWGLVPLHGNNVWLHAALAMVGAYFGWAHRNPTTV